MSSDYQKLEKAVLALSARQRTKLLEVLAETLDTDSSGNFPGYSVGESRSVYLTDSEISANKDGFRMDKLDRITQQPGLMGGKACIRGSRVTVGMVVGQIGAGVSVDQLLVDYPYIEREDIMQALRYAAWRAEEREIVLASA